MFVSCLSWEMHYIVFLSFERVNVHFMTLQMSFVACRRRSVRIVVIMSGDAHQGRRRRPPRMYVVESDYKVQDHLEGTIRLQRGQLCQEQEEGGKKSARGEYLWVKVRNDTSRGHYIL